ncbi:MAG: acyl--CoA ligase, partial [Rhodospirillaceae bacterium]|nr:acyl--CoA ligase [Rhodospirillaceae bacterium]
MRVIDFFDRGALLHPDRAFMIAEDGAITTYRDVQTLSHRTALAMVAAGFGYRKNAAIYSPNAPGAFDALLGIYRAGGAWVPINARNAIAENAYILDHNDVEFLFYNSEFEDNIKVLKDKCPRITNYVCLDGSGVDAPSFHDFVAGHEGIAPDFPDNPDDICGIFSSGGTTGLPKG